MSHFVAKKAQLGNTSSAAEWLVRSRVLCSACRSMASQQARAVFLRNQHIRRRPGSLPFSEWQQQT